MAVLSYTLGEPFPTVCRDGALTIGNFDGVHRGHQALLEETIRQAERVGGPSVAVTFDPPPSQVLRPQSFQPFLTPVAYRCELMQTQGVAHVVVVKTTPDLLHLKAREFFREILQDGFRARAVVEGFNFGFGKDRAGTAELLQDWGRAADMSVSLLAAETFEGKPVSSSRVRADLAVGQVTHARSMLGRPYRLFGTVGRGAQRGQTIGFPTANLERIPNLIPGHGVFAVRVHHHGQSWGGAAHIGPNITFGVTIPSVEVHLLDFQGDLYGHDLALDFLEKVRDTRKFMTGAELVQQVRLDVERVREILADPRWAT